jgi:chromosome partitioning protein
VLRIGNSFIMTKVITIANQKGGVGKTTTVVNLATALSTLPKKVLIIDLDPQGNASTGLGIPVNERQHNSYTMFRDASPRKAIRETRVPGLCIIPANTHLSAFAVEIANMKDREFLLKQVIQNEFSDFDYVFIDTPPTLGLLTINALAACHSVLIPTQCEFYAMEGLAQLVSTIKRIQQNFNKDMQIQGIVLTMSDGRSNLSLNVEEEVRNHFKSIVYRSVIPRNVKVSEAPSYGLPVLLYNYRCPGSQSYVQLAREFVEREESRQKEEIV